MVENETFYVVVGVLTIIAVILYLARNKLLVQAQALNTSIESLNKQIQEANVLKATMQQTITQNQQTIAENKSTIDNLNGQLTTTKANLADKIKQLLEVRTQTCLALDSEVGGDYSQAKCLANQQVMITLRLLDQSTDSVIDAILTYHSMNNTDPKLLETVKIYYTGLKAIFSNADNQLAKLKQEINSASYTQVSRMAELICKPDSIVFTRALHNTLYGLSAKGIACTTGSIRIPYRDYSITNVLYGSVPATQDDSSVWFNQIEPFSTTGVISTAMPVGTAVPLPTSLIAVSTTTSTNPYKWVATIPADMALPSGCIYRPQDDYTTQGMLSQLGLSVSDPTNGVALIAMVNKFIELLSDMRATACKKIKAGVDVKAVLLAALDESEMQYKRMKNSMALSTYPALINAAKYK
jgi:hypothetical protein